MKRIAKLPLWVLSALVIGSLEDAGAATLSQKAYLKASNAQADDGFGRPVAIWEDTVVVGAKFEDSNALGANGNQGNNTATDAGAVYVFVRSGGTWAQQAYLKASNTEAEDNFGAAVAIYGDIIVVGAPGEDSNATGVNGNQGNNAATDSGAAYVFVRNGSVWTQQAYLKASNTETLDRFGTSVAISGDMIIVGAPGEASSATGINGDQANNGADNSGAAYIFLRNALTGVWAQQAYAKASNTGTDDGFGHAVAIAGNFAVVGAPGESSNAVGVNGNQSNNSAQSAGAAYILLRNAGVWANHAYLKASNTEAFDVFGFSVAMGGDTIVVGATGEDSNATGVNGDQTNNAFNSAGAAYVFFQNPLSGQWTYRAYLKASNPAPDDFFGHAVAVGFRFVAVGADGEDSNATGINGDGNNNGAFESGAAYVYLRGGSVSLPTWSFSDYVKPSNTGAGDDFGGAMAAFVHTLVVGAFFENSSDHRINGDQADDSAQDAGAAYIFTQPAPEIVVEEPANINVPERGTRNFFVGENNTLERVFQIRNLGDADLTGLGTTIAGTDAGHFSVTGSPVAPVPPGGSTMCIVRFTPSDLNPRNAVLRISSNDVQKTPFEINLHGRALSYSADTDGDGLSDGAEAQLATFGFDWQVNQQSLVNDLFGNANDAGLYTLSQIQALNIDTPLIAKDPATGEFKLTIGVQRSTDLMKFNPFPMSASQTVINGDGKLEFRFTVSDNAALFRLEAH